MENSREDIIYYLNHLRDKITLTDKQKDRLTKLNKSQDTLLKKISDIQKKAEAFKKEGQQHELKDALKQSEGELKKLFEIHEKIDQLYQEAEEGYFNTFKGDYQAILEDAKSIIDSLDKAKIKKHPFFLKDKGEETKKYSSILFLTVLGHHNFFSNSEDSHIYERALIDYITQKSIEYTKTTVIKEAGTIKAEVTSSLMATATVIKQHQDYDILPNSTVTKLFKDILQNGTQLDAKGLTRTQPNLITGAETIIYEGDTAQLEITIDKINQIGLKQDENARKLFNFLITKANEQNKKEVIHFELKELVDRGIYKTENTAYKGTKLFLDKLLGIQLGGTQWVGYGKNKQEIRAKKKQVLIGYDVTRRGTSEFEMKKDTINFFCLYYSLFPKWIYNLKNNKAYALADHVYYIAHQRKKGISKNGVFNISFENIRIILGLPSPKETEKHSEKIINPILKAIEDIELEQEKNNSNSKLFLTPFYNFNFKNASDFLSSGYLQIKIDCETKKYISKRNESKKKKEGAKQKRIEQAKKNTLQKELTKKYEAGEIDL